MNTYYDLLSVPPKATPIEVRAIFRRFVARYRPTITIDQLSNDQRFLRYVNAYLTLHGDHRFEYDELIAKMTDPQSPPPTPRPYDDLSAQERQLLMAQLGLWRQEMVETIHLLRSMLEKNTGNAEGWSLLGEVYFTIGRVNEGVNAYTRAVKADPENGKYATRLQHAQDAAAGKVQLQIEPSPEEELLREERQQRRRVMLAIALVGIAIIVFAFFRPINHHATLGFLNIPWNVVFLQCLGTAVLLAGLGFGRVLEPFERALIWSSVAAGDRGTIQNYPIALLLLAMSAASLWLGVIGMVIIAIMDDEWRPSTLGMLGICIIQNLCLVSLVHFGSHLSWGTTLIFGGNLLPIAGMFGWWLGSMGKSQYD